MKAVQIEKYTKDLQTMVKEIPVPTITDDQVLVKVKVAAVNPLELLNITGAVKLMQDYPMPLTLGNELTGVVEKVGDKVKDYQIGEKIYSRLPIESIGAFAEYVAIDAKAIAHLPENLDFSTGAAAALTGLTAYQALHEELQAKAGQTVFIPGGSGSFGQMAIPLAKNLGLTVIVSGSAEAKERTLAAGADKYLDYKTENYWELLEPVDFVIDTLGEKEFDRELSIIKPGGKLVSLIAGPNKQFAIDKGMPKAKQLLFGLAGKKFDKKAREKNVEYRFIFVRSDGEQLKEISRIIEKNNIVPAIDPTVFRLEDADQALQLVAKGHPKGKVLLRVD
ncbi:NADP-dependent oxidoreductase [Enterococcus sp.]|uniref:NADP-dependent oxidoreductase n=1 Tax=Enterococcus sp. TaxID=35783 RepID=UPI00291284C3|nr:NADP-dependent oxidoreductase [Enterococcus sp.]MDU5335063.1 NADP-dependent oxidoreductase [Enterococcus sp.]